MQKHTIHSIKRNYKLGLQLMQCYKQIAVSTKCHRIGSALAQQHQSISYEWNILTISCHTRVYTWQKKTVLHYYHMYGFSL